MTSAEEAESADLENRVFAGYRDILQENPQTFYNDDGAQEDKGRGGDDVIGDDFNIFNAGKERFEAEKQREALKKYDDWNLSAVDLDAYSSPPAEHRRG